MPVLNLPQLHKCLPARKRLPMAAGIGFVLILMIPSVAQGLSAPVEPPPSVDSEQVDLRPRFVPGQAMRYEMSINSRSQLSSKELPEMDGKQAMKQTLRLSLRVLEAGSDGATLEMIYDAAKVSYESDEMSAEYDSANPPPARPGTGTTPAGNRSPDPLADPDASKLLESLVKGMVGAKLLLKTDSAGNITSVTGDGGLSIMSKSFMASVGGSGLPGLGGGAGAGGAGGSPSPSETAKWLIGGLRPSGMARVGETWTNIDSLGGTPLGEFQMRTEHTLATHRAGIAAVKFSGKATATSAGSPSPTGFQLDHMTNDGTYQWDTRRGMLLRMDADMRVGISASLTGILLKSDSVTTVSVKQLER